MDCLKAMVSIFGQMEVLSKVILNKAFEMVMAFGKRTAEVYRCIRVTTQWIKRQAMEFIYGKTDGATRVIFRMNTDMDMVNFMMERVTLAIVVFGRMETKLRGK